MEILLLYLVFLPLLSGILFLFFRSRVAKYTSLIIALLELLLAIRLFILFRSGAYQPLSIDFAWLKDWGINLELGLDGINILLVLLTAISVPIIMLAGWDKNYHNYGLMDGMVLILQGSLMGVYLSFNAIVYYIFWEMTLIPAYLIILLWGGERRMQVTLKFFIYTLAGSLFMLLALISLYLLTPGEHSFSLQSLSGLTIDAHRQLWIFVAFMAAFFIKTPIFPFHSWQPETYTQSPSAGTMLIGGLMSKMGIFSMLRWMIPTIPQAVRQYAPYMIAISIISLLYASVIALRQKNSKTLFAYSSIAHLSLAVAGVFTLGSIGMQGALLLMFSHGLTLTGLFFVADIFKLRTDSQELGSLGGVRFNAPVFGAAYLVVLLASIGLPLLSGFPGEFLIITGILIQNIGLAAVAGLSIILGAVYMLSYYRKAMHGEPGVIKFSDLSTREMLVFGLLAGFILCIGIFPTVLLKSTEMSVDLLVKIVSGT